MFEECYVTTDHAKLKLNDWNDNLNLFPSSVFDEECKQR